MLYCCLYHIVAGFKTSRYLEFTYIEQKSHWGYNFFFPVPPQRIFPAFWVLTFQKATTHKNRISKWRESNQFYKIELNKKKPFTAQTLHCNPIPYRASTGPEQSFPCEVFHTGKNLISLQGTPVLIAGTPAFITGISLWENFTGKTLFLLQGMGLQCRRRYNRLS